ncbi:hypothetical protein PACTADRAFT_43859 [Pachysolen tannophilus NRRL Y-2460]|uniref:Fe2OG dioxygenase domain-containing protein n=1 Tax=Pachysolen tannophilus NRRL Y-2460 TaxID=669874 RepID=A0A1E4TS03_PACTA|nr:hypothetical protein PACTADRAFT_43859 [Pachysolen tannophilus NRRL Y-2460]
MIDRKDEKYNLRPFLDPPETKLLTEVPTISLDEIDLSLFKYGEENISSRRQLAKTLENAITTYGFFNITNIGYSWDKIEKLRSISQSLMEIPEEEKLSFLSGAARKEDEEEYNEKRLGGERGSGFKPKAYWKLKEDENGGVRDAITHYNFRDFLHHEIFQNQQRHPQIVLDYKAEISDYFNFLHNVVIKKILNLCDLILGLEEGFLFDSYFKIYQNEVEKSGGGHGRFMLYEGRDDKQDIWLRGHSDISGFSIITSQPMLSLQIFDYFTGKWSYVNHKPQSLIVNIGDALEFITGGYFKACIHRVSEPPADQRNHDRMVIIYFANPKKNSILDPDPLNSKKLKELGFTRNQKLKDWEEIRFEDWNNAKGKTLGTKTVGYENSQKIFGRFIERWHQAETV